jgi:hypothetical protein
VAVVAVAAVALGAAASCAGPRRREAPEPALRIWTPGMVYWRGTDRTMAISVENGTSHAVRVEAPGPRRARVVLYVGAGADPACAHAGDASGPPGPPDAIAPGDSRGVRVDLEEACGRLPPGEYRYEVGYEAPAVTDGPTVRLRTSHGHVVVEAPGPERLDRGSLGSGRGSGG